MTLSSAELFLIAVIVILASLYAREHNRLAKAKFAGGMLTHALSELADGNVTISRTVDGEIRLTPTEKSNDTSNQN